METKERKNTNTRSKMVTSGKGVENLEMNFWGKKYDTQFTSTGKKIKCFLRAMLKLAVHVTFIHITSKKGIQKHGERAVSTIYNEYTQLKDIKLMRLLDPDSLTISQ